MQSIILGFGALALIWSTTSLGIVFSIEGNNIWSSLLIRILFALAISYVILRIKKQRLGLGLLDLNAYLPGAVGLTFGIGASYLSLRTVPSGVMTVAWGAMPLMVGCIELTFGLSKRGAWRSYSASIIGLLGLVVLFSDDLGLASANFGDIIWGMVGITIFAITAVWYKYVPGQHSPLQVACGSLFMALPVSFGFWLVSGASNIMLTSNVSWAAVIYLACFGSSMATAIYAYLLKQLSASEVTSVFLVTPVLALFWGALLNNEVITIQIMIGTAIVLAGLSVHLFRPKL